MFHNKYQKGFITIFYSCGSSPLQMWDIKVKYGCIRRLIDEDLKSLVMELTGSNVSTTYIICPKSSKSYLGIQMPFLTLILKNMCKYFTFEITIKDDKNICRRFHFSNFQKVPRIKPFCSSFPICMLSGWTQIRFDLADFTHRVYCTRYEQTVRMQLNANCRVRRIYFSDKSYDEKDIPNDYKLFGEKTHKKPYIPFKSKKTPEKKQITNSIKSEKIPWIYEKEYSQTEIEIPMISPATTHADSTTYVLEYGENAENVLTPDKHSIKSNTEEKEEKGEISDEDEEHNEDDIIYTDYNEG